MKRQSDRAIDTVAWAREIVKPRLTIHMSLVVSSQRPATPLTMAMLALTRQMARETLLATRASQ